MKYIIYIMNYMNYGQQNMLRSLLTKSNNKVLTTPSTCTYLFMCLKLFLHIPTPIF